MYCQRCIEKGAWPYPNKAPKQSHFINDHELRGQAKLVPNLSHYRGA